MFNLRYKYYHFFRHGIRRNSKSLKLAQLAEIIYTKKIVLFGDEHINSDSLPLTVLINWTRTIADSVLNDPAPLERLNYYNRVLHAQPNLMEIIFAARHGLYNKYEIASIWGAVFYWLSTEKTTCREDVFDAISDFVLEDVSGQDFFWHFKDAADTELGDRDEPLTMPLVLKDTISVEEIKNAILAYPTYRDQLQAFSLINDMLTGNLVWTAQSAEIKKKIMEQARKQPSNPNIYVDKNYGSLIGQNNGLANNF